MTAASVATRAGGSVATRAGGAVAAVRSGTGDRVARDFDPRWVSAVLGTPASES